MTHRVDLDSLISELVRGKLVARADVSDADWCFWERRNLNMHRVVGAWRLESGSTSVADLGEAVRAAVSRRFRRAWWCGLGFGIVVEMDSIRVSPEELASLVDGRENTRGTWQWVLLLSRDGKALGVHTWIAGFLSPVYVGLLARLQQNGFEVASARKEKDGLMRLLTAARPGRFPEFRDAS